MGNSPSSTRRAFDYDLVVVGAGSAGLTAATFASDLKARVLLIERRSVLGGDCTWNGCVPSKALIAAAHAASASRGSKAREFFGRRGGGGVDASTGKEAGAFVRRAREAVYSQETPEVLLKEHGVETCFGEAVFESDHVVRVGASETFSFWKCVVNTGSRPVVPKEFLDGVPYDTNETIFDDPPASGTSLAVIGGGPIGAELAQACARLGADVVVFAGKRGLLPRERPDARDVVVKAFEDDGIECVRAPKDRASAVVAAKVVESDGGSAERSLAFDTIEEEEEEGDSSLQQQKKQTRRFDRVLVAAGRECVTVPSLVDVVGLKVDPKKGGFVVDPTTLLIRSSESESSSSKGGRSTKTKNSSIYAAGDCIAAGPQFTHVAGVQGYLAARNALLPGVEDASHTLDVFRVPRVTYTDPEVGSVGLADVETAARVLRLPSCKFHVVKWTAEKNDRALCEAEPPTSFVELVLQLTHGGKVARIVGGTVVAARAGEMLSEIAVIAHHKLTTLQVAKTIHPYPTFSFVIMLMCSKDATARFLDKSLAGRYFKSSFAAGRGKAQSNDKKAPAGEGKQLQQQRNHNNNNDKTTTAAKSTKPVAEEATTKSTKKTSASS